MLKIDDPNTWPENIIKQLNAQPVLSLLKSNNFIEHIDDELDIQDILADVDDYAESEGIVVYHCTKQLPEKLFKDTGLRLLDLETHHREFLELIRNRPSVSKELFNRIEKALSDWRVGEESRERKLWFCLRRNVILYDFDSGSEYLLKCYGGEAIYMPFIYKPEMKDVTNLLEELGEPVVVEARLSVSSLRRYKIYSLGRTLVGCFANSINPDFHINDYNECGLTEILPCDIIAVHPHKQFIQSTE